MSRYVANAISLGMLDSIDREMAYGSYDPMSIKLEISRLSAQGARDWVRREDWISIVGHDDTAALLSELLGVPIIKNMVSTSIKVGDCILVCQYNGERLAEGAKTLPPNATIRYFLVSVRTDVFLADASKDEINECYLGTAW
jgi:ferredoxin-fold anticodon binding domain-containing protein